MGNFFIKKGRDIPLKGAAKKKIIDLALPKYVAIQPDDFRGLQLRLLVKVDDFVKVGTPVLSDKDHPRIQIASSASGKVVAINRGPKRALRSIVIETDGLQQGDPLPKFSIKQVEGLSPEALREALMKGKLWNVIRQRPFSKIAHPAETPKSIFVHAMNTEPLAADIDFILQDKKEEFQMGLRILQKMAGVPAHLCVARGAQSKALDGAEGIERHTFWGPHPAGNVSTHIHSIDPIKKGDVVWYVEAQDVVRVADLFLKGVYPVERVVAVTGEGAANHQLYARTVLGAPLESFLGGHYVHQARCLSGSILTGKDVGAQGFLRYYDSQVTIIPAGGKREFLGWLSPGAKKYTFSKTYASAFVPVKDVSLDSDMHGGHRAMVLNDVYDRYVPLEIMTYFLLKAIMAGNIEESEALGILECDEEDFALCTFACPSKTDVGDIIRAGLDLIEKENRIAG